MAAQGLADQLAIAYAQWQHKASLTNWHVLSHRSLLLVTARRDESCVAET